MSKNQPVLERFFDKVVINEPTDCWEFVSSISKSNCGRFYYNGKCRDAYKIGYFLLGGIIPEGYDLHHTCENRLCVNPEHLMPLDRATHITDFTPTHITYKNKRKTHCSFGHPLSGENVIKSDKGVRRCLSCARRRTRECQAKKRAMDRATGKTKDKRLKWTQAQIIEMTASTLPRKEICKKFGISESRLSFLINNPSAARPLTTEISKMKGGNIHLVKDLHLRNDLEATG